MEIPCTYDEKYAFYCGKAYCCEIKDQFIPKNAVIRPKGCHNLNDLDIKYTNEDVIAIVFDNCRITKVPQGLKKTYPNMKILSIWNSSLKNIQKNDLIEYKNLERIGFCDNKIEYLRGDLFEGFENLLELSIYGKEMKLIEPNILDGLDKLDHIELGGKQCPIQSLKNAPELLEVVKNDLILQFYKNHKSIKNLPIIERENKQLKTEIQRLIEENKDLHLKNVKFILENSNLKNKELIQTGQKGMQFDIKTFIQDDNSFKDLKILIDNQEFPVHKILIAARSPTLAEILKNNPEVENLNLVDISVEIFEIILKFLYTDELPGDDETNFLHLFAAAGKLRIEELMNYAAGKLMNLTDDVNALDILKISNKYEHEGLRQVAFEVLKKEFPKVEFEDEWAKNIEIVIKIIEGYKMKEEMIKKAEEQFQDLIMKIKNFF